MRRPVYLHYDLEALRGALLTAARMAIADRGMCAIALAGGSTPRALYEAMAQPPMLSALDWSRVAFFWGDERFVPPDHPASNFRMAFDAWLRYFPQSACFPMPTMGVSPEDASHQYERTLRSELSLRKEEDLPIFDLILLGMGDDGHTASLFPGDSALEEQARWVAPAVAPFEPAQRLTLTLPVINAARQVWFLVKGASKIDALRQVLHPEPGKPLLPAARVKPVDGELLWWLEKGLDAGLQKKSPPTGEDRF